MLVLSEAMWSGRSPWIGLGVLLGALVISSVGPLPLILYHHALTALVVGTGCPPCDVPTRHRA